MAFESLASLIPLIIGHFGTPASLQTAGSRIMVVKALSWALRELGKKHPEKARKFLADHRRDLAARVIREVENKLTTGLKNPRRRRQAK